MSNDPTGYRGAVTPHLQCERVCSICSRRLAKTASECNALTSQNRASKYEVELPKLHFLKSESAANVHGQRIESFAFIQFENFIHLDSKGFVSSQSPRWKSAGRFCLLRAPKFIGRGGSLEPSWLVRRLPLTALGAWWRLRSIAAT